jgi:parallel beta-helix repeat protein
MNSYNQNYKKEVFQMPKKQILTYSIALLIILIEIEQSFAVHYIPSDTSIGIWDDVSRTYTLTTDVSDSIEIDENNLALDGDGYTVFGAVNIIEKTEITIININFDGSGVFLRQSNNCTVKNNTVSNSIIGIGVSFLSDNCTVTGNTVSNCSGGISVVNGSPNCTITGNTVSNNYKGINVFRYSDNCAVTGNTISNHDTGIDVIDSDNLTIADNNISGSYIGIFGQSSDYSELTNNTISGNDYGIIGWTSYSTLTGNTFSYNDYGISIGTSYSTLTGNAFSNNDYGMEFYGSDSTLTSNTFSNNNVGLRIQFSTGCQTYNNNFLYNIVQCSVDSSNSSNCIFYLQAPTGGNYWSNWTTPDIDSDGFVDSPFVFEGGQDNLPWTVQDGWITPQVRIEQLIAEVESLNLQQGISNSLDSKLDAVEKALDDVNENNDGAAVNALEAFINAVNAQRGGKISEEDANVLIEMAQHIIDLLTNG